MDHFLIDPNYCLKTGPVTKKGKKSALNFLLKPQPYKFPSLENLTFYTFINQPKDSRQFENQSRNFKKFSDRDAFRTTEFSCFLNVGGAN